MQQKWGRYNTTYMEFRKKWTDLSYPKLHQEGRSSSKYWYILFGEVTKVCLTSTLKTSYGRLDILKVKLDQICVFSC